MKKLSHILFILILSITFLVTVFVTKKDIFTYQFDHELLSRYFRSQDIPHEVAGRVFLSDSEIHIAAGYTYVGGYNPTQINFQHPPFIKYLYGLSIILTNNPYYIQLIFGLIFLFLTYILGWNLLKNRCAALLTAVLLIFDPLFIDVSSQALLDLGQAVFALLYVIIIIYYPRKYFWQGISLGLLAASKFWTPALFFTFFSFVYGCLLSKKISVRHFIYSILLALGIFSLSYGKVFIDYHGKFNLVYFQLKTLKYWFNHSVASFPGSTLFVFLTGYLNSWWGNKEMVRANVWSVLWPISFSIIAYKIINLLKTKRITEIGVIYTIPLVYLLYLSLQAPFPRYFIVILPYLYLSLVAVLILIVANFKKQIKI